MKLNFIASMEAKINFKIGHFGKMGILEKNWKNLGIFSYVDISMTWGSMCQLMWKSSDMYFHGGRYTWHNGRGGK
jgi:hypothetical protein